MHALNVIAPETPPLNDMSKGLREIVEASISTVVLQIRVIDDQLNDINLYMSRLQPWSSGRIGVTCENAARSLTVPRPKVFRRNRILDKWNYRRVGASRFALRVKTARAFHANRVVMKELASMVTYLMTLRASLVASVMNFEKSVAGRMTKAATLSNYADRLFEIYREIKSNQHCTDFSMWYRRRDRDGESAA